MSSVVSGSDLYPAIHEFLVAQGLDKTAKQFLKDASLSSAPPAPSMKLLDMYKQQVGEKRKREGGNGAASDSDDSDDSDS
jgi:hypothetical protein